MANTLKLNKRYSFKIEGNIVLLRVVQKNVDTLTVHVHVQKGTNTYINKYELDKALTIKNGIVSEAQFAKSLSVLTGGYKLTDILKELCNET